MKNVEVGALILRLVTGIVFLVNGFVKFQGGIGNIAGWFDSIGLPGFLAYPVALLELLGGIALIIGLGSRVVSALFVLLMIGAIGTKLKLAVGFLGNGQLPGYEFDLTLLAMAAYLLINGSHLFAVDRLFKRSE